MPPNSLCIVSKQLVHATYTDKGSVGKFQILNSGRKGNRNIIIILFFLIILGRYNNDNKTLVSNSLGLVRELIKYIYYLILSKVKISDSLLFFLINMSLLIFLVIFFLCLPLSFFYFHNLNQLIYIFYKLEYNNLMY